MIIFTGLDTETTGLSAADGDRIIEISLQAYDIVSRRKIVSIDQRFSMQGAKMKAAAEKVHGISAADLIGAPMFKEFAPKIAKVIQKSTALVIHNAEFDLGFICPHLIECGETIPDDIEVFDTMKEGMFATYDAKSPNLGELCFALGVPYNPKEAHAADYDVDCMMAAFFAAVDKGYFDISKITQKAAA